MSYPQKSVHPLEHQGTAQRERLLKSLLPENLLLDDRSMADLLAFAGDYAGQIRFWNQANSPDGDWTSFWEKDMTSLLAIVSATDLDQLQVKFRSAELDFVKACKKEKKKDGTPYCEKALAKLHVLVEQIFEAAVLIDDIYRKLPDDHLIKAETAALIQGKLGIADKPGDKHFDAPLARLVSYHKGISTDNQLIGDYETLTDNQAIWGLTVHDFLNCIDYRLITHKDQEALWRLFLDFFKVLTILVNKARTAFQTSLDNRGDHPPHIALFLAFCFLFRRYHQADLNGMAGKHLDYYYHDVLRLQERREIPDRVHLVFEIARDLTDYRLEKDTLFLGGKDKNGNDLLYGLADETVLNKAMLVEKQNLYFYKEGDKLIPIALPKADFKDGFKIPFPKPGKLWHPFWAGALYKKLNARLGMLQRFTRKGETLPETLKWQEQRNQIIGRPGFLIASPELYLAKGGAREISVGGIDPGLLQNFDVSISTKERSVPLDIYSEAIEFALTIQQQYRPDGAEFAQTVRYSLKGKVWISSTGNITGYAFFNLPDPDARILFESVASDFPKLGEKLNIAGKGDLGRDDMTIALEFRGKILSFKVVLVTKKGNPITKVKAGGATGNVSATGGFEINFADFKISGTLKKTTSGSSAELTLPASFPDIVPLKNDPRVPSDLPFLRFTLKPGTDLNMVSGKVFENISISTASNDLKNVNIQVGDAIYSPTSEISFIGTNTGIASYSMYVIAPELSFKRLKQVTLSAPALGGDQNLARARVEDEPVFHPAETKNLDIFQVDLNAPVAYSVTTPYAYFRKDFEVAAVDADKPINIYKIPGQRVSVSYISEPVKVGLATGSGPDKLYHVDYLGGYFPAKKATLIPGRTLPAYDALVGPPATAAATIEKQNADGDLRLGLADVVPGQTLSMLFHFAAGTGNPAMIAPDEIAWSYLRENEWVRLPPQYILGDETLGLRKTGIIRFQIPADINNGNTRAIGENGRKDLYWLQASAVENPELNISLAAMPQLNDIFAQAATAVFQNNDNDLAHIDKGLPAFSIAQPRFRDTSLTKVEQPYISFDGRHAESTDKPAYYRRIHERLRHKNRAVTIWDYERLTLENFPKVALVKCLPHTRDEDVRQPGYVTLGVVPYPSEMTGDACFYPIFNAGDLEEIERLLNRLNSYFVSGKNGGVICCCSEPEGDSGCGCHDKGRLLVRNAVFEPVRLQVCVKFRKGKEELFYKKQLNNDLKSFLAPWATDEHSPLVFGTRIDTVELLRFLEDLDYVDVVLGIKVKHFPSREIAEASETLLDFEEAESIEPFTSRSLLTTYLDILNEDNPNVLDHEILLAGEDGCADCGCK